MLLVSDYLNGVIDQSWRPRPACWHQIKLRQQLNRQDGWRASPARSRNWLGDALARVTGKQASKRAVRHEISISV